MPMKIVLVPIFEEGGILLRIDKRRNMFFAQTYFLIADKVS